MQKIFKHGFTVVELVVVIVVIAILVSLTAIGYNAMRDRTYDETVSTDLKSIAAAMDSYKSANGVYPKNFKTMSSEVPEASFSITKDSYDLESAKVIANGKAENLLICSLDKSLYAAVAVSKSGKVLAIKSSDPNTVSEYTGTWSNDIGSVCNSLGFNAIYRATPNFSAAFNYSRDISNTDLGSGWNNLRYGGGTSIEAQ